MKVIQAININQIYRSTLFECMTRGQKVRVRNLDTHDLGLHSFIFICPWQNILLDKQRKLNYAFMFRELWWYLTGDNRLDSIKPFNKNIAQFSDDGNVMYGAYGPHIVAAMPSVIKKLKEDIFTRQAIIPINSTQHNVQGFHIQSKDIPCTLSLHFIARKSHNHIYLDLISHMRSQDLWWGFPYDVANFSIMLCILAKYLNCNIGIHTHIVDSLHIYIDKINVIYKYVHSKPNSICKNKITNFNTNKSWFKDYNFLGINTIIEYINQIIAVKDDQKFCKESIDKLFPNLEQVPNLLQEHAAVMLLHLMKNKKIPTYKYGKIYDILVNIDSPFKWLF